MKTKKKAPGVSRRKFMKEAALGTGAAAALGRVHAEESATTPDIRIPDDVAMADETPLEAIDFPMSGADIFARACKEEGLEALFCCPGNYQIVNALVKHGIPSYGGRHEGAMASAADAFCRATGEIAACSGTEGPGFTNMICAIAAANSARSPLLVLASNMSVRGDDTEANIQRGYQQPTTEGLKKYGKRIIDRSRVHEYAGYAFRQLRSGVPRPVHLDFVQEVTGGKLESSDQKFFYDKSKYRTESRPHPDPADIRRAVDMISKARRPIIVSSMGVFYAKAWDALRSLAEKGRIPVAESGPMRGQFSDAHPLSASAAPDALPSADLVILVGQYCMPTIGEYAFGPDAKYIRIDPNPEDIGRNLPIDLGIVADERAALEALADALPPSKHDAWEAEIQAARQKFDEENDELYRQGASYTDAVHPAVIAKELRDFLYRGSIPPEETTVVQGGFGIARYTRRFLRAHRPAQIVNGAYQYGAIGPDVGYTFGTGIAVSRGVGAQGPYKGHPLFCVTGDAGFGITGFETETLAMYRIPAIVLVYNNNSWGTWAGSRHIKRGVHIHLFQENLRYDKVAEALGARGEYVTTPDALRPAIERSYEIAAKQGVTTVINCQAKKEFHLPDEYPPGFLGKVEPGVMSYHH